MPTRKDKQWQHYRNNKTMRQVRKQIKRNRKTKKTRRRDWEPHDFQDLDALDGVSLATSERIMPRGERERRQAVMEAALASLAEEPEGDNEFIPADEFSKEHAVVIEVSSGLCRVVLEGRTLLCGLRGSLSAHESGYTNVVAVGDRVVVSENGSDRGVVESVLPRQSALARPDSFHNHLQQVIVANAEQLLIVASWRDPVLWFELVDRYLITAERNNLWPIICINKIDLAEDGAEIRAALRPYQDLGYRVILSSALGGEGIGELRQVLRNRTTVLSGMSGVGKSSLLMAVQPNLQLDTSQVSDFSGEGCHTTSQVTMFKLEMGGFVVDTPGIREFGLSGLRRAELSRFYPEIAAIEWQCRFGDCSHTHEPGCVIKTAVQDGRVSETRYHNFAKLYHTLPG